LTAFDHWLCGDVGEAATEKEERERERKRGESNLRSLAHLLPVLEVCDRIVAQQTRLTREREGVRGGTMQERNGCEDRTAAGGRRRTTSSVNRQNGTRGET